MPNYCIGHIRLPNGRSQNVTIVLHGDIGDGDDDFVPTQKPISLHLGSGSRSWRGGQVDEMDDDGHPTKEDVMLSTTDGILIADRYGERSGSNLGNMLAKLLAPTLATETTRPSLRQRLLSRWTLSLLPYDWRHWCIRRLTTTLHGLVKFSLRAVLVIAVLLFLCRAMFTFQLYHDPLFNYLGIDRSGADVDREGSRNELQEHLPVMLLPFELPNKLNYTMNQYGSIVLAGTDWLVRETAPIISEVAVQCGCSRPPKDFYDKKKYSSKLCQALCSTAGSESFLHFPGTGLLLSLQSSLKTIKGARKFWLEDLSPRWLDMAHAQEGELKRMFKYLGNANSYPEDPQCSLGIISTPPADRLNPHATTLVTSTSLSSSYYSNGAEQGFASNSGKETYLSQSELQAHLHNLIQLLHHLQPNTRAYVDNRANAISIFENSFVPRNDRLLHAYDRAISGFLPDINIIDLTWKGTITTFVHWEEWLEELGKVLVTVRRAATNFDNRSLNEGDGKSQPSKSNDGEKKNDGDKDEAQLALHVQTACSKALGHVRDARNAANAVVQSMEALHRVAKTYSTSGWRVRKTVADLERDGMVPVNMIIDTLENRIGAGMSPIDSQKEQENGNENETKDREARVREQVIEAWIVWPVGEEVREDIEKVSTLMSPRKGY
ncbi:hypothetical protein F4810DRAFT_696154 [Camillea tinctor]|nr:hypothetical protein F4810DRAFT_696154 [Camillea tinctor]